MRRLWNDKREHYEPQLDRRMLGHPHSRVRPRAQRLVAAAWHRCGTSGGRSVTLKHEIRSLYDAQLLEVSAWQKRWSLRACQNRNKKAMRLGGASTITRGSMARRSISMRIINYVTFVWQRVTQMQAALSTTAASFLQSARALARATA